MERSPADGRRADDPTLRTAAPEGKRNVSEGRLIWVALSALRSSVNVVLDYGVWGQDERSALRASAASIGATSELDAFPIVHLNG